MESGCWLLLLRLLVVAWQRLLAKLFGKMQGCGQVNALGGSRDVYSLRNLHLE